MAIVMSGLVTAGFDLFSSGGVPFVDLAAFYQRSWALIDFLLLFALFAGVSRATVGRRLEGRAAELVSLALGTILALAGLGLELSTGVRIGALGGIAAGVFLLIVGTALFGLLRHMGCKRTTAAAAGALVLGLGTAGLSPGAQARLGWLVPLVQLGAFAGVILLIVRAGSALHASKPGGRIRDLAADIARSAPEQRTTVDPSDSESDSLRKDLRREKWTVAHRLRPITRKEKKDSRRILRELKIIRRILSEPSLTVRDRKSLASALSRIPPKRHRLRAHLDRILTLDRALQKFDFRAWSRLRDRALKLNASDRRRLHRLILEERKKIGLEQRIDRVERFVGKYDAHAARSLEQAALLVTKGRLPEARQWVEAAVRYEEEAEKMLVRLRAIESLLLRLTEVELRQIRKAA